jgi:deoxyribodipyrimidine photo-lyase
MSLHGLGDPVIYRTCFMPQHLVWFRSDLRTLDNPALFAASQQGQVTGLFLLTPEQWRVHGISDYKIAFMLRSIDVASQHLAKLGIETQIVLGSDFGDAPSQVLAAAKSINATKVFWNDEVAIDEQRRDTRVTSALADAGIAVERHQGFTSLPPGSVRKPDGSPYSVFTPFKKRWFAHCIDRGIHCLPRPEPQGSPVAGALTPAVVDGVSKSFGEDRWPSGEANALTTLQEFAAEKIRDYESERDLPNLQGTSQLSPHLAAGTISANQCLEAAYQHNDHRLFGGNPGADTWISELVWREFYNHILAEHPRLATGHAFKKETDALPWNLSKEQLQRWQQGETGFPFVDAGMRQLNATGWMHNRLRMVTAQFLAKHLFLDWRLGESYFMARLVDGDFAANNGGWQWSASTGTDAVPYFRIFNPIRQAERFDPNGDFVRRMIPELAGADKKQVLEPWKYGGVDGYPAPMIDLSTARDQTLAVWKLARS